MAEIAIPAVALGAMYILSNRNEEKDVREGFENKAAQNQRTLKMGNVNNGVPAASRVNYPVQTFSDVGNEPASYPSPNAATDRYYQQEVYEKKVEDQAKKEAAARKIQVGSGDRSQKIRTYNYPQNRVTDHRINLTLYSLDDILQGNLDVVFDALISADQLEKLKQ